MSAALDRQQGQSQVSGKGRWGGGGGSKQGLGVLRRAERGSGPDLSQQGRGAGRGFTLSRSLE